MNLLWYMSLYSAFFSYFTALKNFKSYNILFYILVMYSKYSRTLTLRKNSRCGHLKTIRKDNIMWMNIIINRYAIKRFQKYL